jgi:hypothetical protein
VRKSIRTRDQAATPDVSEEILNEIAEEMRDDEPEEILDAV